MLLLVDVLKNALGPLDLQRAEAEVAQGFAEYRFDNAARAIYEFVWEEYCDWYVELSKPVLTGPDGAAKDETRAMAAWALDEILKLLHPVMPFLTEELWAQTRDQGAARTHASSTAIRCAWASAYRSASSAAWSASRCGPSAR